MHEHTIVRISRGKYVRVCTDTQKPLTSNRTGGVETMVFRCSRSRAIRDSGYQRPVDVAWCKTEEEGVAQHQKMVEKWAKEILY